jgi:hypothetical protein
MMTNRSRAPYYRDRARGLRVSAAESKFADIRQELQEVAKQFDRLADAAERRQDDQPAGQAKPVHWSERD